MNNLPFASSQLIWAVMACSVFGLALQAKAQTAEADRPIDAATRQEVIETTLKLLQENYIFLMLPTKLNRRFVSAFATKSTTPSTGPKRSHNA